MKEPQRRIHVAQPLFAGNEKQYVLECLESGWVSSIGKFIGAFEQAFAEYCDTGFAISCNNGTSALHLALTALGVGPGDEVIVPTLTYVATANAVLYCGARPVLVDADATTMALDPQLLEQSITPRTKAIIVVHLYGHPADMDPIVGIARRHGIVVIEDAAEAHGAQYRNRKTGALGEIGTFSFYGNKIVTTGEGGMVTTNDAELAEKIRLLRGQGMDPQRRYWFPVVGYNYRMTNIAAAIGLAQLEQINKFLQKRRQLAHAYNERLGELRDFIELPREETWATHSWWSYTIVLREHCRMDRDELIDRLSMDGIETRPVFYAMHRLPIYQEPAERYPVADRISRCGISLPMHVTLMDDDICYVAERIASYIYNSAQTTVARRVQHTP